MPRITNTRRNGNVVTSELVDRVGIAERTYTFPNTTIRETLEISNESANNLIVSVGTQVDVIIHAFQSQTFTLSFTDFKMRAQTGHSSFRVRASYYESDEEDEPTLAAQLEEQVNLVNTANWGLSLTSDNATIINDKISKLDSNKTYLLLLDETYPISSVVNITNKRLMLGGGGGLKAINPFSGTTMLKIRNCPNIVVQNLNFDGQTYTKWGIDIQDSEAFHFKNIKVENIGNTGINGSSGILVSLNNHRGMMINVKVKNVIGTSVATGINVDNFRDVSKGSQYLLFDNCYVENVQPAEDGDGLKILQSIMDSHSTIRNCSFINCAKRGIKAQSKYVYTKNNYVEDSWYAGIDFQRGYGKSTNDTIVATTVAVDNMIAVSGEENHIISPTLISTAPKAETDIADGIYINNGSGSNTIETLIIEKVKMRGLRYPFSLSGITNIDLLRIDKSDITGFSASYVIPSFTQALTINTLHLHENKVEGTGSFFGFIHQSHTINEYFATNNTMPGNIFGQAYPRKLGVIRDNIGQTFIEEKGIRYTWETIVPSSVPGSFYENAKKGDIARNTNLIVLGTAGSQYVVKEWLCIVDGDKIAHTKGTWVEVKVTTGT
jgi:hypothetical protein